MSVKIERQVVLEAHCVCGQACRCIEPTRKECFAKAKELGWTVKLHRRGESTVVCPECAGKAEKERVRRISGRILAKQKKVSALAEYKDEMAALKSGEEVQHAEAHQDA